MQTSKFFNFSAWACLVWEGMVLRDIWKQEEPVNHGLQRTLGPWNQDSAACAEARGQQFTTKTSLKTPELETGGVAWVVPWLSERDLRGGSLASVTWRVGGLVYH